MLDSIRFSRPLSHLLSGQLDRADAGLLLRIDFLDVTVLQEQQRRMLEAFFADSDDLSHEFDPYEVSGVNPEHIAFFRIVIGDYLSASNETDLNRAFQYVCQFGEKLGAGLKFLIQEFVWPRLEAAEMLRFSRDCADGNFDNIPGILRNGQFADLNRVGRALIMREIGRQYVESGNSLPSGYVSPDVASVPATGLPDPTIAGLCDALMALGISSRGRETLIDAVAIAEGAEPPFRVNSLSSGEEPKRRLPGLLGGK